MEELEFNHIAPYLPDGLKYQMQIDNSGTLVTITVDINSLDIHVKRMIGGAKMLYGLAKPIYHPLSDLTKEIKHNGEKFVPIVKIAEMAFSPISKTIITNYSLGQNNNNVFIEFTQNDMDLVCNYSKKWNHFELKKENKYLLILGQYELYQKLFEWKFDVFNLIEKGLAIDVNILSKNIYK